jgi:phospholipid-binding lipoprotein MlaA
MKRNLLILGAWALSLGGLQIATANETTKHDIVIITRDGIVEAPVRGRRISKDSDGTLYLRSAAEPSPRQAKTKKGQASPSPKPRATPLPLAVKKELKPIKPILKTVATPAKEPTITIQKKSLPVAAEGDDLDEYGTVVTIADPAEPVNRGTFWLNHQLYTYILRPVSKAYEFVLPSPARKAINNIFDNVEYPVRVVNHALQLEFKRADLETRKFVVNSVAGVGGILRMSDRIPDLANIPPADTGQTLAKWGIGHGAYVVLPVLGPRSVRDTVGMAGDYALNPVSWLAYGGVAGATTLAVSGPSAARNMNERINLYDAATQNAIDPYIAVRSGYIQYREQAASR